MLDGIILIALGLLAASSIIVAKLKNAEGVVNFLTQFQGYIGIVGFAWGVWAIIRSVMWLGYLTSDPIAWIIFTAMGALEVILGFMFGFGLISQYALSSNEEAKAKAKELLDGLAPWKTVVGLAGLGLGVFIIIAKIIMPLLLWF